MITESVYGVRLHYGGGLRSPFTLRRVITESVYGLQSPFTESAYITDVARLCNTASVAKVRPPAVLRGRNYLIYIYIYLYTYIYIDMYAHLSIYMAVSLLYLSRRICIACPPRKLLGWK